VENFSNDENDGGVVDLNDSFGVTNRTNREMVSSSNIVGNSYIDSCITNKLLSNRVDVNRDDRLELALKVMDLESVLGIFNRNKLNFNDMLFLSKEDMIELDLALVGRNRILKFSEAYRAYGKEFSMNEILAFFNKNKSFIIKPLPNRNFIEEDKHSNNYENHVQSTANFEKSPSELINEVFVRKSVKDGIISQTEHDDIPKFGKYSDELTLSDYVQRRLRDDSEERASQTYNINKYFTQQESIETHPQKYKEAYSQREFSKHNESDEINIKAVTLNNKDELNNSIKNSSGNTSIRNQPNNNELMIKEVKPKQNNNTKQKNKITSKEKVMRTKKNEVIQNKYSNIDTELDCFMKSYKDHKEKSDDRLNRMKCFIERSKSRSHSKKRNKDQSRISNYDSVKRLGLNLDDLEIEDERNLRNEMSKLLNRINSASKLSLDSQGMQQLNRIKSLTNLKSDKKNIELLDVNFINQVIFTNIGTRQTV
jgi:hypothetical protein